uniref:Genome polyprotein n=1 Tax=Sweet wormwood waikavirus TaxID=3115794 RepID=A0AAT9JAY9_9SECO
MCANIRAVLHGPEPTLNKMNNNNNNSTASNAANSVSTANIVNKSIVKLVSSIGISFESVNSCKHYKSLYIPEFCDCNYCNFLTRLNKVYIKNKCILSRVCVRTLSGVDFRTAFHNSCLLFLDSAARGLPSLQYAAHLANNKLGNQYVCPILGLHGSDSEECYNNDCWGICCDAKHLFECFSTCDQTGGEFFPIYRKGLFWHATCTSCSASACFTTPREGMILFLFMSQLKVIYDGARYFVSLKCDDERVHCSRAFANLVVGVQGGAFAWHGIEVNNTDPEMMLVLSNVCLLPSCETQEVYGCSATQRFAKDDNVLSKEECDHTFYLTNSEGTQLKLSQKMMRVLLMLMPTHCYMTSLGSRLEETLEVHNGRCGIVGAGGLIGVNMRCNNLFLDLHKRFYSGPYRVGKDNPTFVPIGGNIINHNAEDFEFQGDDDFVPMSMNCTQQSSGGSSTGEEEEVDLDDEDERVALVREFLESGDDMLVIKPKTQTRGLMDLSKRIGGLLKGVTNCVRKMHVVWDWPLDTILKSVDDLGSFLKANDEYISKDVWACQMCPEVRNDVEKSLKEQQRILELLQGSVKKLATSMDSITAANKANVEKLEEEILKVQQPTGFASPGTYDDSELKGILSRFTEVMRDIEKRVAELEKKKSSFPVRPMPAKTGVDNDEDIGERKAVPRRVSKRNAGPTEFPFEFYANPRRSIEGVSKQSGVPIADTVFEGGDIIKETINTSHISVVEPDPSHDVLRSKIFLGDVKWSVSSGEGKILKGFEFPSVLFNNKPYMKNFASFFEYYTCSGFEITVTTTSVGMQGGTLLACWDAMNCATKQEINSVLQLSNLPHERICASSSSELVFRVDSPSIQHMMSLTGSEHSLSILGTFYLCVANVLNAAVDTSQDVKVNVWARFLEPKFSFQTKFHDLVFAQDSLNVGSLDGLSSVEAIVANGKWSTNSGPNLLELTVHPTACYIQNGVVTQTVLSVISHMFSRWSGSLLYRIVIGASLFVKGKLLVCAVPVAFREKTMSVQDALMFAVKVCDLSSEHREFEFEVPYSSIGLNSLVCRDSLYDVSSFNAELVTTRLHFLVLDPLVMNANASNSVSFFVTVRPGKDFTLYNRSGVKAEFVDRVLKQVQKPSLTCGGILGNGFSEWTSKSSILHTFEIGASMQNALCLAVSPFHRRDPPCITNLSWLSQIFVAWNGSLNFTFRAHSHERSSSAIIRIWHDINGSTQSGEEFEFISSVDPPAGIEVHYWKPFEEKEFVVRVPYMARSPKLLLHKARFAPSDNDWLHYYNGILVVDYEGAKKITIEMSVGGGDDFNMFEQTVAPRCGEVTNAFTKLSYARKLQDISKYPLNDARLSGPVNKAVVDPVKFDPKDPVKGKSTPTMSRARDIVSDPREGDEAEDEDGNPLIYTNGEWVEMSAESQAGVGTSGCFTSCIGIGNLASEFSERDTARKAAEIVDSVHEHVTDEKMLPDLCESMKFLLPLLKKAHKVTGDIEDKLEAFGGMQEKIMSVVKGLMKESIPGMIKSTIDNEKYAWATMLTILGGSALIWFCASKRKFLKKFSILCMIVWAPFLGKSAFSLGKWIKEKVGDLFKDKTTETCRKHSLAGTFEGLKGSFGSFTEWFSENWASAVQRLLSVLGVVASLVIWGTIPDGKKLTSFSQKFKEVGDKGRSFSNIFSGFNAITKMSSEWSKKFVSWMLGSGGEGLPKSDSLLQQFVAFDIREWVKEVRQMALEENKFVGYGTPEYISKVRHLYSRSVKIQEAILNVPKVDVQLSLIIKNCHEKCTALLNTCYTFKGMSQPRIDPIHVCMLGAPGVGKSTISHVIINNLLDHCGEPEIDRIYTRCCADAYWSCYRQEPVLLYDDLGAIKSNMKLSDYAEIMGVKTNDPFSIPMAIAEEKGKHCTSKYVFSCTNTLELDDTGDVVSKLAYYRRRNVLVKVERDPDVAMNPENPTLGLLFTVLGHTITNPQSESVVFDVKTEWPENFLRGIDTQDWTFERVNFKTFMKFLCVYTDAYMKNQKNLLGGIKDFRMDPFADDVVVGQTEAQVGDQVEDVMTLGELANIFSESGIKPKVIYDFFIKHGVEAPGAWNTNVDMNFWDYLESSCGCIEERECNRHFLLTRLGSVLNKAGGSPFHKKCVLKQVALNPVSTTFKVKDRDIISGVHPAVFLHSLLVYHSMSFDGKICPFHQKNRAKQDFIEDASSKEEIQVLFQDRLALSPNSYTIDGATVYIWPGISKLFPVVSKYGFLAIKKATDWIYFSPSLNKDLKLHHGESIWRDLWVYGTRSNFKILNLLRADDRAIARGLIDMVDDFGDASAFSESLCSMLKEANEMLCFSDMCILLIYVAHCNALKKQTSFQQAKRDEKKMKFLQVIGKIDEVESKMHNSISSKAKIALSIGGGIVAAGLLVGVFFGLKASLKGIFGMLSSKDEEIEEAEAEMSSGKGSAQFKTHYVFNNKPVKGITTTTLEPHMSGGNASASFKTQHVFQGKPAVRERLKKQNGFGTFYDESDSLKTNINKEVRKKDRKKFIDLFAQSSKSKKIHKSSPIVTSIEKWQGKLVEEGLSRASGDFKSIAFNTIAKNVALTAEGPVVGERVSEINPDLNDENMSAALNEILKCDVKQIKDMLQNGTTVKLQRQVRIGETGMNRDKNMSELVTSHVSNMSCAVIGVSEEGILTIFGVMRLKGTYVCMPAHYQEYIRDSKSLYFCCLNKVVAITYDPKRMCLLPTYQDVIVWDLGSSVPPSTDYMKHIMIEEDWKNFRKCSGVLVQTKYEKSQTICMVHDIKAIEIIDASTRVPTGTYTMLDGVHTIIEGLRYNVNCSQGTCGAPIVRADSKSPRKIMGMHVAGHSTQAVGYAELLSQERLQAAIDILSGVNIPNVVGSETKEEPNVDYVQAQSPEIEGKGNLGIVGTVASRSLIPSLPAKTTICKTPIHGMLGPVQSEPAILSAWDWRLGEKRGKWNPVLEGVKKYGTPIKAFPLGEISVVEEHLSGFFSQFNNSLSKREVNNMDVGINGIQNTDFWSPMEMKTSPGYPYVLRRPANSVGKSWMFKQVGTYPSGRPQWELSDPECLYRFNIMQNQIIEGITPDILTMECVKDERRKLSKIYEKPATRTFTILPPEINLLFRMYFGDFAAMIMETRHHHFSQVGINCETMEWSEIMNKLRKVGTRGFAGDYAKFDGIGAPQIYHSIVNVVNNWYNDGAVNARARHCLINSIVHRFGLVEDLVVRYSQGMPSGFSMTVIFNSFVNYYYMALAWQHIISHSNLCPQSDLESFDTFTKIVVYGDDNVVAVDDRFLQYYNLRTVASYLSGFGISYTDDAKNPIHLSEPHVDISTVTFLKRSFVRVDNSGTLWKAPLNKVSIEERCNWIRETEIPDEAMYQNIESALYEAAIHGEDYFNDLKGRINNALDRVARNQVYDTFKVHHTRWWSNMTNFSLAPMDLSHLAELSRKNAIDYNKKYKDNFRSVSDTLYNVLDQARRAPAAIYVP